MIVERWLVDLDPVSTRVISINRVDIFSLEYRFNVTKVIRFVGTLKSGHEQNIGDQEKDV
jgi:hypothetical protein